MRYGRGFEHLGTCCRASQHHGQEALRDGPLRLSLVTNSHRPNTCCLTRGPNGFGYIFRRTLSFQDSAPGCQTLPIHTQDYFTMEFVTCIFKSGPRISNHRKDAHLQLSFPPSTWVLFPDQNQLPRGQRELLGTGGRVGGDDLGDLWKTRSDVMVHGRSRGRTSHEDTATPGLTSPKPTCVRGSFSARGGLPRPTPHMQHPRSRPALGPSASSRTRHPPRLARH